MAAPKRESAPGQGGAIGKAEQKPHPKDSIHDPVVAWHALGREAAMREKQKRGRRGKRSAR